MARTVTLTSVCRDIKRYAPVKGSAVHEDVEEILISAADLSRRIAELGREVAADYGELTADGQSLLLVGVLKGAVIFLVDLAREIPLPLEIDFMATSSYGASTKSSGVVRILKDLDEAVADRHVLIVEDIIDTGLTLRYILHNLATRRPASVRVCGLLLKEKERPAEVQCDYVGFRIPDRFVVGYGLDYGERYRNLPYVAVLKPSVYGV